MDAARGPEAGVEQSFPAAQDAGPDRLGSRNQQSAQSVGLEPGEAGFDFDLAARAVTQAGFERASGFERPGKRDGPVGRERGGATCFAAAETFSEGGEVALRRPALDGVTVGKRCQKGLGLAGQPGSFEPEHRDEQRRQRRPFGREPGSCLRQRLFLPTTCGSEPQDQGSERRAHAIHVYRAPSFARST